MNAEYTDRQRYASESLTRPMPLADAAKYAKVPVIETSRKAQPHRRTPWE